MADGSELPPAETERTIIVRAFARQIGAHFMCRGPDEYEIAWIRLPDVGNARVSLTFHGDTFTGIAFRIENDANDGVGR